MKKGNIKLLTWITLLFLSLMILGFGTSAFILYIKANDYNEKSLEQYFNHRKKHLAERLSQEPSSIHFSNSQIIKLEPDHSYIPKVDRDTLIMNEDGQLHLTRIREVTATVNGQNYLMVLLKDINDITSLKHYVIKILFYLLVSLTVFIVLSASIMSKYLFNPFQEILRQMRQFKVSKEVNLQKIETRTIEFNLLQDLFQEMGKSAQKDYRLLKEYTENMAHEFQTPLAIIRSKSENLIADDEVMKMHTNSIKAIYDETNQLSKLGNTLKLLTKIENNEFVDKQILFSNSVILNHVKKLNELAGLKAIEISTSLDANHLFFIDPFLLEIILKNLLKNAIAYAPQRSTIYIKTVPNQFSISNIAHSKKPLRPTLFERFSRGGDNPSSLGLGLAIVKKICDLNQLSITYNLIDQDHVFLIRNQNEIIKS